MLLLSAPHDELARTLTEVLDALRCHFGPTCIVDGPFAHSVLASRLNTTNGSIPMTGRVRLETDHQDDRAVGWVNKHAGAAGRWVVQHLVAIPTNGAADAVDDGQDRAHPVDRRSDRQLWCVVELLGPSAGGPPPVDDPVWRSVCGALDPTDLQVMSLARSERQRWVAHDGDGFVFAEVILDQQRSLGIQEISHELSVRVGGDRDSPPGKEAWVTIAQVLGATDEARVVEPLDEKRVVEPLGEVRSDLIEETADPEGRGVIVTRLSNMIEHHTNAITALTKDSASRDVRRVHREHLPVLGGLWHVISIFDDRMTVERAIQNWSVLEDAVDELAATDVWVRWSDRELTNFAGWARSQRESRAERLAEQLAAIDLGEATAFVGGGDTALQTFLGDHSAHAHERVVKWAKRWRKDRYPANGATLNRLVVALAELTAVDEALKGVGSDSSLEALKRLIGLRTYYLALQQFVEVATATTEEPRVLFEGGRAIERSRSQQRRLRRRAIKSVDALVSTP